MARYCAAILFFVLLLPAADDPGESVNTRILNRAAKLLADESHWNRADTRECPPHALKVSLYCALREATEEELGESSHRSTDMEEVHKVIQEKLGDKSNYRLSV